MIKRFFLETNKIKEGRAVLNGSEAKHIAKVLRLGTGDMVYLLDEKGTEYQGVISSKSSRAVEVKLLKTSPLRTQPAHNVILGQALPKAQKMDYIFKYL